VRISRSPAQVKGIDEHTKRSISLEGMRSASNDGRAKAPGFFNNALNQPGLADPCLTLDQERSGCPTLHCIDQLSGN
jgi:hypothetical protein